MFQQQPPPSSQQQMMQQQRKEQQQFISAEAQAREKLSHYVYEYLMHLGAVKTADMFKNEVLAQNNNGSPNMQIDMSGPPGFLFNWFSVFWDLYSAHPDKREKAEASNDAKTYHKMLFPPCPFPEGLVNGGMYGPPPGFPNPNMGPLPGPPQQNLPDGMFPGGYYNGPRAGPQPGSSQSNQASPIPGGPSRYSQQGARSGAPTPVGIGNNFQPPPHMNNLAMNEQMRIAMAQQHQQRQAAQQQGRLPMNLPPAGPQGKPIRPQFGNQYMDSPSGTPPFSNQIAHNGGTLMSPSAAPSGQMPMTSASAGPMPGGEGGPGSQEARFMMTGSGGMQQQQSFMNHHEAPGSTGTPTTAGPGSVSAGMSGSGNVGVGNGQEGDVGGSNPGAGTGPNSQLHSLLNGTAEMAIEMKQSPAFGGSQQPGGVNGGTPGNSVGGAGPGSVHSQSGVGTNNLQSHQTEGMEIGEHLGNQRDEISKIKASLMEGFPRTFD